MVIAALFTITKVWKQRQRLLMNECIKKIYYLNTHTHTLTIWENMDEAGGHIMLAEISHTETQMLQDYTFMWNLKKNVELIETESRMVVARGWNKKQIGRSW